MSLESDIKTVRDYVVGVVDATWTDVRVTHEDPKKPNTPPVAWVRQGPPDFQSETVSVDVCTLSFTIHGKWNTSLSDNQRIDKAAQLRTALLANKNPGSVGYLTEASEFTGYSETDMLDPSKEVGVLYMVRIRVPR